MNDQAPYESLVEALNQAIEYKKGNKALGRVRVASIPEIIPIANYSCDNKL